MAVPRGIQGKLVKKSLEAYVLALETINRLSACYRYEAFLYLICNAWELLLKARILSRPDGKKALYTNHKSGERHKTIALRSCLDQVFSDENDPVRTNLIFLSNLRDESTHFVLSFTPRAILGLFQSAVLNYHAKLREWWGESLSQRIPAGMMVIAYDFDPKDADLSSARLRRELGADTARYLMQFQKEMDETSERLGRPSQFSVPIEYRLALTKKTKDGDIILDPGPNGEVVGLVKVAKDPSKDFPYLLKPLVKALDSRLVGFKATTHHLQCVRKAFNVEGRADWFYKNDLQGSPQYSLTFFEWCVAQHEKDGAFFLMAVEKVKRAKEKTQEGFDEMRDSPVKG